MTGEATQCPECGVIHFTGKKCSHSRKLQKAPWDLELDEAENEKEDDHTLEESRYIVTVDKTGTVTGEEIIKPSPGARKVQVDRRRGIVTRED